MNNKLIKILFAVILFLNMTLPGFCTDMPESVILYVKERFPEAGIRFDGLVELPDGTKYLPVMPLVKVKRDKPLEIVQTIPEETDFNQKPDMILFNNNLALLKIIEKEGKRPTVISSDKMPLKVKLGLLPQNLVVPKGLILPPELKVILGDLKIPLKPRTDKEGEIAFYGKTEINKNKESNILGESTEYITKFPELKFLKKKKLYVSNYKLSSLSVINSQTGRDEMVINLPSMAFDMTISSDGRYILMPATALNQVFVIDSLNNQFVKTIEVGKLPITIITPPGMKKAFVSNRLSSSISVINLDNMQVEKEYPVKGQPEHLGISENKNFLFFNDARTGKIFQLNLETGYFWEILEVKNISKIDYYGRYLFVLSRSQNTLTVYDFKNSEIIKETITGDKPLDMAVFDKTGKILVVCAGADELNIIDTEDFEVIKKIPLKTGGFPGKIILTKDGNKALITNYDAYEIIIYNVIAEKIQGHLPVNQIAGSVVISDE